MITEALIADLPKTDLHVHLDGSLRLATLIDLARQRNVELPSTSESGLRELVFKDRYNDLVEYLNGFQYTCAVLDTPEALERVACELAEDNMAEGVRYLEVRFAPMLHINALMDMRQVIEAVDRGLARAKRAFNDRLRAEERDEPEFDYGIITCAMRMFTAGFSPYYRKISEAHSFMPREKLYGLASLELARAVVSIRDDTGMPIVGFDLAGAEHGYPAEDHIEAYDFVHRHFMKKTVHAGEAYGPESIFQAISLLHADRIGHGYHLLDASAIRNPKIEDPQAYVNALCQYIAQSRLTLEVCLTSNMDTDPDLKSLSDHPFGKMKQLMLSTSLCTDNRLVSRTTVTRELKLAVDHFGLTSRQLKNIIIYGFKRSFFPRDYTEKRRYVRQVIDYYRTIEQKHGLGVEPVNDY
jgi:adenosine deaminase